MTVQELDPKVKGSAPGQYLGYALQPVRFFYHLLHCKADEHVGLEYIDDVSVHTKEGVRIAEQCKSALSQNPVSNWSVDLWKTFANWINNIHNGHLGPDKTQYQIYVTLPKSANLSQKLSDAKSEHEINLLLGEISKRRAKMNSAPACEIHLQKVLAADPSLLISLFRNYRLINEDISPIAPIEEFLGATLNPHIVTAACHYGIGFAKRLVDDCIRHGQTPLIRSEDFRMRFRAFIHSHDSERFLHSLSAEPTDEIIQKTIVNAPRFVRQLEIVEADIDTKTRAASDFLRTISDRTLWADQGLVFEESMEVYDDALTRRHQVLEQELSITKSNMKDPAFGLLLYLRCCQSPAPTLEDRVTPVHFMSGSLNSLAEQNIIGWHPKYKVILGDGNNA